MRVGARVFARGILACVLGLVMFAGLIRADVVIWDNESFDSQWSMGVNWSGGIEPTIADEVTFGTPIPNGQGTIALGADEQALSVLFQADYILNNGTLTLGAGGILTDTGVTATVNASIAGTSGLLVSGGGTLVLTGQAAANTYTGTTTVLGGTLIAGKNAGTIAIPGDLVVELGATFRYAGNTAGDQIADGATVTINGGIFGDFPAIGTNPTNPGASEKVAAVSVTGGTLSTGRAVFTATGAASVTGGQIAVVRGGTFVCDGLMVSGPGIVGLDGGSTVAGGTRRLRVNGGGLTLQDGTINFNAIFGTSDVVNSQGSLFELAGNVTSTGASRMVRLNTQLAGAIANIDLQGGDRTFDVTGTLNIGAAGAAISLLNGGIIKTGAGKLSIPGAHLYTGNTTISGGIVEVNGSLASAAITVGSGGTLAGVGTLNGTAVQNGGSITAGIAGAGNLSLGLLTLNGATTLNVTRSATPAVIVVSGANGLVANGTVTVNVAGFTGIGQHVLVDYNGTLGGAGIGAFAAGMLPNRIIGTLVNNAANSSIDLNVTALDLPVWNGRLGDEWSTAILPDPKNWALVFNGAGTTDYIEGDVVLFNDSAIGTDVNIPADVTPGAVTFDNITKNYTLGGTAGIAGNTGLVKTGAGTLTITNVNSFAGTVSLNGGIVTIAQITDSGTPGPLGSGSGISFGGGTLEYTGPGGTTNRAITVNAGGGTLKTDSQFILSASISGSGPLTKTDSGTVTLSANNSAYNGGLTIKEGTIQYTANGLGNNQSVTLDGGTLASGDVVAATFNDAATILRALTVTAAGGSINIASAAGALTFARLNGIGGAGRLTKTGPGRIVITQANNTFSGEWEIAGGAIEVQNTAPTGLGSGKVTVDTGGTLVWQSLAGGNTLPNNIKLNGGNLQIRSGDSARFGGAIEVAAESSVTLRSLTSPANSNSITIDGLLSGSATLNILGLNPQTNGGIKSLFLTNLGNTYSGTFKIAPGQILFSLPISGTGNTLGTAAVEINGGVLALRDEASGSNTTLPYGNDIAIIGLSGQIDVNRLFVAGPNTGNTFRLGSLTIGSQTFFGTGGNGYKIEFSEPATFSNTPSFNTVNADLAFSGEVSGNAGFAKTGNASLSFNGINTLAGFVDHQAGTLEINGTFDASTSMQVQAATLAGIGTFGGSVAITDAAAVITPGVKSGGTGILGIGGDIGFFTGSEFAVGLGHGPGLEPVAGTDYDQLNVTGSVVLNDADLVLTVGSGIQATDIFFIILNAGEDPIVGNFAGLPDGATIITGGWEFRISYDGDSLAGTEHGGNDVALLVPEPASAILLLGGLSLITARRRRR